METQPATLDKMLAGLPPFLSKTQKMLYVLLAKCEVGEDALVGTMLVLKDSVEEQEEMLLYLWDNKPTPEEIDKKLVEMVLRRNSKAEYICL